MTIPALRWLRRTFPNARITLWVKASLCDLFRDVDFVDEFRVEPLTVWHSLRPIRSESYGVALLFQNAFRAAWIVFAARIPVRCGYRTDGRGFLLTHPVPMARGNIQRHQVFSYLNLVSALGHVFGRELELDSDSVDVSLPATLQRKERGLAFLAERGADLGKALVIINPGATNSRAKRWLPDRFAALSDRLLDRGDVSLAFIGAPEEVMLAHQIAGAMRHQPLLLTGRTDVGQLVEVLSCADLLISNDTGPAHVGAALGVPTLAIFGPTEHFATRPLSARAVVIRKPVSCSPCMLRDCPIDHRCMTGVTVDDVLSQAGQVLDALTPRQWPVVRQR